MTKTFQPDQKITHSTDPQTIQLVPKMMVMVVMMMMFIIVVIIMRK